MTKTQADGREEPVWEAGGTAIFRRCGTFEYNGITYPHFEYMTAEIANALESRIRDLERERDAYRDSMLHALAASVALVADAALVAHKEYSPAQIHHWTLRNIEAGRDRLKDLEERNAVLEAKAGLAQRYRDDIEDRLTPLDPRISRATRIALRLNEFEQGWLRKFDALTPDAGKEAQS